jgi:transposase
MSVYLGIDVAKRQHKAMLMGADGSTLLKPFTVTNNRAGMDDLLKRLAAIAEPLEVGLEATGHYWLALYDQLTQAGYTVHVLNPLQVHAYQRSGIRKHKSDPVDAVWIADFVRIGGARDHLNTQTLPHYLQLRQLARFRFSLIDQIGDAKRRALSVLDRVFPEYEQVFSDVFIATSRALLNEAVMPQDFANFPLDELTSLLAKSSHGRFGYDKATQLQTLAQHSIGVSLLADAARVELGCLLAQITFVEQQVELVDEQLARLVAALPDHYLTTIPGVGAVVAATLLGEIGDIARCPSIEQLVAYSGIDPTTFQSGQFQASETHMSKRGSPYLRRALWLAAGIARQYDPQLKTYYEKRRAEGKPYGTVMGALCRKLLNRIYVVLRDQRPYVPRDQ